MVMTRKACDLEAKLKLAATQLKEVKEDRDRLLQEQEDSEAEFLANLSRVKSLNGQLAELHAHHEDAISEVNRLTTCLRSIDNYHESYDLMLQQNKDLQQELSECKIKLDKLECKPLPSAISLNLQTELMSKLSAEPSLSLVSVAGCNLHTIQTIDLTKDDSVCNLEPSSRDKKHIVSRNKLKKYIKINKLIKKSKNLLKNQKHLVSKLKSKRLVLDKFEHYKAQVKYNQSQYDADMKKLRYKLGQAEHSLEQYISLYTQTTEQTRELNLAMDALLRSQPERIMSPYTAINRRSANPFELAHIAVSWLIGGGYDAYVVVGCAERDTCMAIRYRTECPYVPDEREVIPEPPPEEEPRYRLVPLPDLTSKYVIEMAKKEADLAQAALDKVENERKRKIALYEMPPPDEIDGWRTHAWVLVLPGQMDVEEPFFIEPSEGFGYPITSKKYQHIESVYNNENYYVNIQKSLDGPGTLSYDLTDLTCWEHMLAGEPFGRRNMVGVDYGEKKTAIDTEGHFDMPASWVEKLDISIEEKGQRYPGSHKVTHYKKVLCEKFASYSEHDGIVKRVKIFEDYALTVPLLTYEWYKHRVDRMETMKLDHRTKVVKEVFTVGRKEHLIKHTYSLDAPVTSVEGVRTLKFNYYPRIDHLNKIVCTPLTFAEYYTDRNDRLESREITYTEGNKLEPKRKVKDIVETYSRNNDVPARTDVWKKIFHMQDNTIELLYHYEYNFVTNDTRHFIKPNLAETGGKILFYPDKTSGYIADPCAKLPRPLDVYYALCDNITWEYNTNKAIRDRETDVNEYLRQRHRELIEPMLTVSLFDTDRNEDAKKGWMEQETMKAEITEREKEAEIDPLAPYLARMFGSGHGTGAVLSVKEATLVREQCINDFKGKQLARQNLVQERFDKLNSEYKAKRLWYLANQFILTPEKEAAYFAMSAELAFQVHSLEVRLTRHRDLSVPRFKILMDYLDKHPLLKEYNRVAKGHKK